jgi:signal transduction histidine kinase
LTISRADAGQIQLQRSRFAAADLARDCASLYEVLLEERGLRLEQRGEEQAIVDGDWLLLRQALLNIVHNAIKFSPDGGTIRIRVEREDEQVLIDVEDRGPGIPAEDLPRLFDRFYRVDAGRAREAGGTGLGLSIAQWSVIAHRGRIEVHSQMGVGSTFRICLPAAEISRA